MRVLYRRRQRRKLALALAVTALFGLGGLLWHGLADRHGSELAKSVSENPAVPAKTVPADDRLHEAKKQIDREELIVECLLAAERVRRLTTTAETATIGLDRQLLLDEQVGQAAMAVLLTGDQRAKQPDSVQTAREDYVCVTKVFPNTIWAERAGERLAALKP
ncbi:MAG: hypothetical protein ACLP9L_28980 [Thermoguttaceae bacterium]